MRKVEQIGGLFFILLITIIIVVDILVETNFSYVEKIKSWKHITKEERYQRLEEKSIINVWDGSVRPLETYIKNNLNNPDSYIHNGTNVFFSGNETVTVVTTFRCKDVYGDIVTKTWRAELDTLGHLKEVFKN